jgi:hypothetical protein
MHIFPFGAYLCPLPKDIIFLNTLKDIIFTARLLHVGAKGYRPSKNPMNKP